MATKEIYRVRKSWDDVKSQVGAYTILDNAKKSCNKAGAEYKIYNSKGECIFPVEVATTPVESAINTSAANPAQMWDFFKSKGLNDYGIAGLMGNLYAESGLRSCNLQNSFENPLGMNDVEYTKAVDNGSYTNFVKDGAGYGLAQWTYWSLKQDLLDFCKQKNKSIGDLNTQMEFLAYQLEKNYKSVWNILKKANSVREASDAVLLQFERPADQSTAVQEKRAAYGQTYFNDYGKKEVIIIDKTEKPKESVVNKNMKYNVNNKPLMCLQTQSTCYKGTSTMTIKGILWHSTGANNPNLKRYVQPSDNAADKAEMLEILGVNPNKNDWNHINHQAGLNAWIGKLANGSVATVQTMPWNYRPWGCGSGSKGSCNNGWIQFEICEDALNDETYFNAVYKEACELTAYLCDMFNINPKGTVKMNGVNIPTILCHADSYTLGFGGNHADVNHWFPKFGKSMETAREDVAKLMETSASMITPIIPEVPKAEKELYRIRKSWEDAASQAGAFTDLENAKKACDKAGNGYEVYDGKGIAIYPESSIIIEELPAVEEYAVGDEVQVKSGSTYTNGKAVPAWVCEKKLYVREIRKDKTIVVSSYKTGAVTGVVKAESLIPYVKAAQEVSTFVSYLVKISVDVLNVRSGPGTGYRINTQVTKNQVYTIVDEKNGWGKLKSGAGWISLQYVRKI